MRERLLENKKRKGIGREHARTNGATRRRQDERERVCVCVGGGYKKAAALERTKKKETKETEEEKDVWRKEGFCFYLLLLAFLGRSGDGVSVCELAPWASQKLEEEQNLLTQKREGTSLPITGALIYINMPCAETESQAYILPHIHSLVVSTA